MRNRAKCKLCRDIIESFHQHDYVTCSCGEIYIDGGSDTFRCGANEWKNFLRVDDNDNEIEVTVQENEKDRPEVPPIPSKAEVYKMLVHLKDKFEDLPDDAMIQPVTHYDMYSLVLILTAILKPEEEA